MDFVVENALKNKEYNKFEGVSVNQANIKVIGVGGAGNNMVDWLYKKGIKGKNKWYHIGDLTRSEQASGLQKVVKNYIDISSHLDHMLEEGQISISVVTAEPQSAQSNGFSRDNWILDYCKLTFSNDTVKSVP